jgi:hypothetical integral membrane protein (TIGR02206 family)
MDDREFVTFGLPHCTALAATVVAAAAMIWLNRSPRVPPKVKRTANTVLALMLLTAVALDPWLTWRHFADEPELGFRKIRETALPFYLCDVVSIVLAVALIFRRQRWAELGYLWGMAGTVQGLITPTLYFSWDTPDYYAFFVQHGGVPVAALALAFGTELKPARGAFGRAVFWSWVYLAGGYGVNWLLHANYGFINAKPDVETLFDHMGPYPFYLLTLQAIAFTMYLLLLLPFCRWWKKQSPAEPLAA